jgi:hypothetical protein
VGAYRIPWEPAFSFHLGKPPDAGVRNPAGDRREPGQRLGRCTASGIRAFAYRYRNRSCVNLPRRASCIGVLLVREERSDGITDRAAIADGGFPASGLCAGAASIARGSNESAAVRVVQGKKASADFQKRLASLGETLRLANRKRISVSAVSVIGRYGPNDGPHFQHLSEVLS